MKTTIVWNEFSELGFRRRILEGMAGACIALAILMVWFFSVDDSLSRVLLGTFAAIVLYKCVIDPASTARRIADDGGKPVLLIGWPLAIRKQYLPYSTSFSVEAKKYPAKYGYRLRFQVLAKIDGKPLVVGRFYEYQSDAVQACIIIKDKILSSMPRET